MTHPAVIRKKNWNELREPRIGIMLHYDASYSDEGAITWLASQDVTVSYNWLITDLGNIIDFAPWNMRAWHAGCCKSNDPKLIYRDANSAFYGVSIAARPGDVATKAQKTSVADLCQTLMVRHRWPLTELWRIVSHRSQAVYCKGHPKAGQRGRKDDPEGPNPARPVMNTNEIRGMISTRLANIMVPAVV